MYLSLYLSYTFKKLLSTTRYDPYVKSFAVVVVFVTIVAGFATPTTSLLAGEPTAIQSLRATAVAVISFTTVT